MSEKLTVHKERGAYTKRDELIAIEKAVSDTWKNEKTFEQDAPKTWSQATKKKFLVTFPYPYMNGRLHLGHAFTLTKSEFAASYKRLSGVHTLYPFGFHCTGMPIKACADKLARELATYGNPPKFPPRVKVNKDEEEKKDEGGDKSKSKKGKLAAKSGDSAEWSRSLFQWEILSSMDIPESEIPKFADAAHWLDFFPPLGKLDLEKFGQTVDWRRSFITTDKNPYYDSFIRWQYNTLRALHKVDYGKRACVFSVLDGQPCADHDRASGEGVGPQEFTLIKMKVKELPAKLKPTLEGKNVFLVAGTLRPETMYGQTNCWVGPENTYGVYEMVNNEYFVCGEWAALNLAYQDQTAKPQQKPEPVATITGQELIGTPVESPNAPGIIYALPFMGIKMDRATGIVTSVPSDAPDDYAGMMDLKNKAAFREKYQVKDEWVLPFNPIPIIETPGYGNLAAVKACDDLKIKSQNDKENLQKAKDEVYTKGFYEGKMLVGEHAGKTVQEAKPLIKASLIAQGKALAYQEPEKPVMSRSGDKCIVALANQWYLKYGETEWKAQAGKCLDQIDCFSPETRNQFARTLDWLNQWACSRSFGLGTRLPFDTQFLVESLSDSTIYMAYYTLAHLLQGGGFEGSAPGPLGIKHEEMTHEVWDYILLGKPYDAGKMPVAQDKLDVMKNEFDYWYGVDLRVSGKDLVPNHLTFFIYTHVAIFPEEKWPKGIRANGHVLLNNEKMSKSTGNYMTLTDACDQYSTSALRIGLAHAGDSLDDANFEDEVANAGILKLHTLISFVKDVAAQKEGRRGPATSYADKLFENAMNNLIREGQAHYERFMFRDALVTCFFNFTLELNNYRSLVDASESDGPNWDLQRRWAEAQIIMLTPICPHISEYLWRDILGHKESVFKAGWPTAGNVDPIALRAGEYIERIARGFRLKKIAASEPKKAKKGGAPAEPVVITKAAIFIAKEYPEWQAAIIRMLKAKYDATKKECGDIVADIKKEPLINNGEKGMFEKAMQFSSFVKADVKTRGEQALDLSMPFSEREVLNEVLGYLKSNLGVAEVTLPETSDNPIALTATPGNPSVFFE